MPTTEPGSEPLLREIPSDLEGFTLSIPGAGTLEQVEDDEGTATPAPEGQIFVYVHTQFRNQAPDPGVEILVSTEGAQIEGPDGELYPVMGGGSAEGGACAECTIEVSTTERDIYLGFLFAVPEELGQRGARFVFTFREAAPIPFEL